MIIRFKVAFDNGPIRCEAGETSSDVPHGLARRLVKCGLAEVAMGNVGLNRMRADAGLPALPSMSMTKPELIALARELGVEFETDDNKSELVRKIREAA